MDYADITDPEKEGVRKSCGGIRKGAEEEAKPSRSHGRAGERGRRIDHGGAAGVTVRGVHAEIVRAFDGG